MKGVFKLVVPFKTILHSDITLYLHKASQHFAVCNYKVMTG